MRRVQRLLLALATAVTGLMMSGAGCEPPSFVNFETIPTRALALSPDGSRLFVTNPADGRLEIFDTGSNGIVPRGSVTVGMEPIAVAVRTDTEVWVVNHVSDSVSVVDVSTLPARVVRTLYVGDEPRDIAFAGPRDRNGFFRRAFVSAARRGQNHPAATFAEQRQPGIGRTDVWVFDAENPGPGIGGTPLTIVRMLGDKAGALEATPDGSKVFVSVATSGNETTIINAGAVCPAPGAPNFSVDNGPCTIGNGISVPGGVPAPNVAADGTVSARVGLIVKFDRTTNRWLDIRGRNWTPFVPFNLIDNDVFTIDALAPTPVQNGVFQHTGTLNEGLAIHPSGRAYLATTEAINTNRFLSLPMMGLYPNPNPAPGIARTADPATGKTLNGHLYESRIAILGTDGSVTTRHLNPHINYEMVPSRPGVKERSVASPRAAVFSADGSELFVVAMGSNKIVPFRTSDLDSGLIVPDERTHIPLSGIGPTSAALDARLNRLYVYSRIDNSVEVVDLSTRREVARAALFSPESAAVLKGRRFFYDATVTSSNGEASCAVCHPSGDKDDLAWDLGAPFGERSANPNPFVPGTNPLGANRPGPAFNPLKGPMTVLTLRGISDGGPLFWRGDATNAMDTRNFGLNFIGTFNRVFPALLGNEGMLGDEDLVNMTLWAASISPPPNPHRNLDNSLTFDQAVGSDLFFNRPTDGPGPCIACHRLDPAASNFGTGGEMTAEGESQEFKVTQLRTVYDKVGMFGTIGQPAPGSRNQLRGFGTLHDGSLAGPEAFIDRGPFDPLNPTEIGQLADFLFVFPSEYAPVVGQQVTLRPDSPPEAEGRIALLSNRARTPYVLAGANENTRECDLVAKAVVNGEEIGLLMLQDGTFMGKRGEIFDEALLRLAARTGVPVTYTCVNPGGGRRVAFDRNSDGMPDE